MDYVSELKELLRPLGIYDVDQGTGAAELTALGQEMNRCLELLTAAERESNPLTAEGAGLENWEALLPFVPVRRSLRDRRNAIAALLRLDGAGFTLAGINSALAGCGARARAVESEKPMTVAVSFPGDRGIPEDFELLRQRIELLLPCHLAVEYRFIFPTWLALEAAFPTFPSGLTWRELERYEAEAAETP